MRPVPPDIYMDGCTMFPDRFGRVSHRPACDLHDSRCWRWRDPFRKILADIGWTYDVIATHWRNWPWQFVAVPAALVGFVGLMTAGWWFWKRRHRFGPR